MSKSKRARFHLRSGETILKQGMMDYCSTGKYMPFAPGDSILTDERFHFDATLPSGEKFSLDIPLAEILAVEKVGIPFLTRSMRILTGRGDHRFNAFFVGRWYKPVRKAVQAARAAFTAVLSIGELISKSF